MLSSPVENVVQSGKEKISGPRVAIGPVSIPGYLDRPQLFLRDGNDVKVELAEFNHWSEPFGEGVTRVLCDAVSASLTPRKGLASPMRSQQPFQWRIAVDIARFARCAQRQRHPRRRLEPRERERRRAQVGTFCAARPRWSRHPLDGTGPERPSRPVRRGSWADDPVGKMWGRGPFSRKVPSPTPPPLSLQRLLTLSNPP